MSASLLVSVGFIVLPIAVAAALAWTAMSRALSLSIVAWLVLSAALALSGILIHFEWVPPPIGLLLVAGFIGTIAAGRSSWVEHLIELPWSILIGFHAFRILVEILIHTATTIDLAPPQMSWHGFNFDIVTGVSALLLAPFARSAPKGLIFAWNILGLTLLLAVVTVAAVSFPTRLQLMRPDNSWVAVFPYVWLPAVLVTAALLGHIIIFRKLRR
ncbi:MAG TPA: hypothetical protein VM940_14510 [Chthoniobacterales bacterium]|nr:hypothetical protein [Chthoniobacterales bacterium]